MFYFYKVHKFRLLLANLHYTSSPTQLKEMQLNLLLVAYGNFCQTSLISNLNSPK